MSVFTKVSHAELEAFLHQYDLGTLLGFTGIGEGIENTNYFVDTSRSRWVLTLFERLNYDDLPFFLGLMEHLARHGYPSALPVADNNGQTLKALNGKPAALVARLTGQSVLFRRSRSAQRWDMRWASCTSSPPATPAPASTPVVWNDAARPAKPCCRMSPTMPTH